MHGRRPNTAIVRLYGEHSRAFFVLTDRAAAKSMGINTFTSMPGNSPTKREALKTTGTFNPRADQVRQDLFQASDFFDAEDLLQVKYETLRAVERDGYSIARAAQEFGVSRPTIYQAQDQFQQGGLEGL